LAAVPWRAGVVVGVDPGVTTGLCAYVDGEFAGGEEATTYGQVEKFISLWQPYTIVIEDFVLRRGRACEYHAPIRMIGVVEYICGLRGIPMVVQSPSILGMTRHLVQGVHRSEHVRSACAHVVYHLSRRRRRGRGADKQSRANDPRVEESPGDAPGV